MKLRTFEWNGDFEACRAEADAWQFDAQLAEALHGKCVMTTTSDSKGVPIGWSLSTSSTFDFLWTYDDSG